MEYRPITHADLEACADVFYEADDELTARSGLPPQPHNEAALLRIFGHIAETDPKRVWLAESHGRVVGFAMACQRGELTFLSFLFVRPDAQARGMGRALLERSMAASVTRAVCIWSVQPIAAALYAAFGMVPRVPLYTFIGRPKNGIPTMPGDLRLDGFDEAGAAALEREVVGFVRPDDHARWRAWQRRPFGLYEGDRLVGYGYAHESGRLGPVVVARQDLLLPFVGELMREIEPVEDWTLNVPGPAAETFEALLAAGLRLDGPPIVYCATELLSDHSRYLPGTFALP